ncbi:MAG: hypothetical protein GY850_34200 [bacterium]|nr:hypothetical protein [bacterium]
MTVKDSGLVAGLESFATGHPHFEFRNISFIGHFEKSEHAGALELEIEFTSAPFDGGKTDVICVGMDRKGSKFREIRCVDTTKEVEDDSEEENSLSFITCKRR